jgi:hypothetical protein
LEDGVQEWRTVGGSKESEEIMAQSLDTHGERERANQILENYDDEEFDVDGSKASEITVSYNVDFLPLHDKKRYKAQGKTHIDYTLTVLFANALGDYRGRRQIEGEDAMRSARRLSHAYDNLRVNGCIVDGRGTKRRLSLKDGQIADLQKQLQETTKKLGVMEERLSDCADEKIRLENRVAEQKERIDNSRAEDIKNSFGTQKSKTEEGK